MAGFIKLHRGWHDSSQFADEPYCERAAWCWLLTNAAWKETTQRNHKGEVVTVGRGQYQTSFRTLAAQWGWSIKRVRTFLKVLEKCETIGTVGTQSGTLISICKYDDYQSSGHGEGTDRGTASHTVGARSGHTKEESKEGKEDKKGARGRAAQCPDDVSAEVWADFLTLRRAKKSPLTQTALTAIEREAGKAGLTLQEALEFTVTKGWQAFNAEYYRNAVNQPRRANGWVDKDGYELPYA
jgi:hypothetical protein